MQIFENTLGRERCLLTKEFVFLFTGGAEQEPEKSDGSGVGTARRLGRKSRSHLGA
jgi:hypothetical protein